jgi:hypothetical protein
MTATRSFHALQECPLAGHGHELFVSFLPESAKKKDYMQIIGHTSTLPKPENPNALV